MAKPATEKGTSNGVCRFCQGEFVKNKMTQHLKSCKARTAIVAKQEGADAHLLHLLVEGTYRPGYWMHLEVPVDATLADLDDFLRAVWLECCDHLSEFTISDVVYGSSSEDDWSDLGLLPVDESAETEHDVALRGQGAPDVEQIVTEIAQRLSTELGEDLQQIPLEKIELRLEQMFAENLPPDMISAAFPTLKPLLGYMASALQQGTLIEGIGAFNALNEDEPDMSVELSEVLNVGDRFSYVYDFGSSTHLSLRVVAEREGAALTSPGEEAEEAEALEEEEHVVAFVVMAHNEPPLLVCHLCGEPATYISSVEDFDSPAEAVLCQVCAQKQEYPDELLPVVNSPRVGVCGYTGEYEEDEWEEEEGEGEEEG